MTTSTIVSETGPPTHASSIAPNATDAFGEILTLLPSLRAYAKLLVGDPGRADDLVETTLRAAWAEFSPVGPPPGLMARLFTILRQACHAWLSQPPQSKGSSVAPRPGTSFRDSFAALPIHQRDALLLLVGEGLSSQDASTICGCSAGTIIRRAERARRKLAQSGVLTRDLNLS